MQPSEQIKEKINIVDFLRGYLEMKPAGRNFKANCPFHQEKTPSFIISPDRQIWHCFGCGLGGDIFKFLMIYENIEFYEALKILAEKAGIELKSLSSQDYRQFGVLYEINEAAKNFYLENLRTNDGVKKYLLSRGLEEKTIEEFEIGYSPNMFDPTAAHLLKAGHKIDDIFRAGIVFKTDRGQYGDRFRGRVMFPIHNHFGKIVGFSGRILPEFDTGEMGKYINSPETPIFNKSKVMYGFWKSKHFIREKKTAVLVEGQMDFLMSWQVGVKNAAASSGTALTIEHLKVLKPIADTVVIAYDNDEAGKLAVERALDLLGQNDFSSLVLDLGVHKDPADAVTADKEYLHAAIAGARSAIQHHFSRYLPLMASDRKMAIRAILQKIGKLYSQIDQADALRELSHHTGMSEKDLREEMDKVRAEEAAYTEPGRPVSDAKGERQSLTRLDLVSLNILGLVSANDSLRLLVETHLKFMPETHRLAYGVLVKDGGKPQTPEVKQLVDFVTLTSGRGFDHSPEIQEKEFRGLLMELEIEYLRSRTDELQNQIRLAELRGDEGMLLEKLKEFDVFSRKMQDIRNKKAL